VWLVGVVLFAGYRLAAFIVEKVAGIIPAFATGGVSAGGLAVVGERGPELVSLPRGSRVHSNAESRKMAGSGKSVNNFNITINAKDTSDAEMRRIAKSVGRQVMNELSRSKGSTQYVR
jgi:phage-related minor tail protein